MRQDIVSQQKVSLFSLGCKCPGKLRVEEFSQSRDPIGLSNLRNIFRRFNSQNGNSLFLKEFQEVPIIARNFDDLTIATQTEAMGYLICVDLAVLEPRIRIRRKIGVVAEDCFWTFKFF